MIVGADWCGKEGIFGGKVIACLAEAVSTVPEIDGLALASLSAEFSGAVRQGELEVETEVLHRGRSTATVRTRLMQSRRPRASAVAKLVAAGERSLVAPSRLRHSVAPDDLTDFVAPWGDLDYDPKFRIRVFYQGVEGGVITTRAWVLAHHGIGLGRGGTEAALLDLLPPGLFFTDPAPAFVPTVDFALHLNPGSSAQEGEWLWAEMRTEWADDQFCAETGTLYRADGTFVARGTQTRRIVR